MAASQHRRAARPNLEGVWDRRHTSRQAWRARGSFAGHALQGEGTFNAETVGEGMGQGGGVMDELAFWIVAILNRGKTIWR